jgi:intracellular septation protein A
VGQLVSVDGTRLGRFLSGRHTVVEHCELTQTGPSSLIGVIMQWQLLFLSIAPIVVYMVFWFAGRWRIGLVAAMATSGVELVLNSIMLSRIEPFSLLSFSLFVAFGSISLRGVDDRIFKMQPVALELIFASVVICYYVVLDIPLLTVIAKEHLRLHDALAPYQRGYATVYTTTLSRSLPYVLFLHAAITAYAAIARSTWWWFFIRVFGLYVMIGALFLVERLLGVTG